MKKVFLDFETYWDQHHTLRKMSAIEYVMHPKTEIQSVAIKVDDGKTRVAFGKDVAKVFKLIDWSDAWAIGHNMSKFDAMILAWRYGIKPKMWGCTLSMSMKYAKDTKLSLSSICEYLNVGEKLSLEATNTKGKTLADFTDEEKEAMREYNVRDVDLCHGLFEKLMADSKYLSANARASRIKELRIIDMTIRMLVEPKFEVDTDLLVSTLEKVREEKQQSLEDIAKMIGALSVDDALSTLNSSAKFKELLTSLGVTVPMKKSDKTGKMIPAIAKTDEAFLALKEHDDPRVAAAVEARLGAKSTLLETRIQAFITASNSVGGKLPIPLSYAGADTTGRWSGWAYNPQNLPRIGKKAKHSDALRNCLRAPKGHKVVVADLSGIELRVNHFLWKVPSSMALYQADPEKADLYKDFASKLYGVDLSAVTKDQRQIGKVAHLGLGFGAGAGAFQNVAKIMGGVDMELDEAQEIVDKWRDAYPEIVNGWSACHESLQTIYTLNAEKLDIDPWGQATAISHVGIGSKRGLISYSKLRRQRDPDSNKIEWVYGKVKPTRIYAGKITENIVQHIARNVIADNMVKIQDDVGISPVHCVHDELIYIVPNSEADATLDAVQAIMRTPPTWWPELVTWSEGSVGDTYGEAK